MRQGQTPKTGNYVQYGTIADMKVDVLIPGESGPGQHETKHQSSGRNYGQDQTL